MLQMYKCTFNIQSVSTIIGSILNVNFVVKIIRDIVIITYIYLYNKFYVLLYLCV